MPEPTDLLRRILIANELGYHPGLAYRFTDADGPGRSGYSFGVCQFDLRHNRTAARCLAECGFTPDEIRDLRAQLVPATVLPHMNARLASHAAVIDRYDTEEIVATLVHVSQVVASAGLRLADTETLIHLCDYHNQYRLDFGGKAMRHFKPFAGFIDGADILTYKLGTAWGMQRPDDVKRRWNNIVRICREVGS